MVQVRWRRLLPTDEFDLLLLACVAVHAVLVLGSLHDFLADDSLFYFQIAYNVAHGHGFTFSGLMPTNGFHPLWLLVCIPLGWLAASKAEMLTYVGVLIVLLNAGTLLAIRDLFRRAGLPHPSAATLFSAPYLFFVTVGMEGHVSALLLVLTMRAAHRFATAINSTNLYRTALLGGLVVLSRLDLAILLSPLAIWTAVLYLGHGSDFASSVRSLACGLLIAAAPVVTFLLINTLEFGNPIPVSGLLKLKGTDAFEFSMNGIASLYLIVVLAGAVAAMTSLRSDLGRIHACLAIGSLGFLGYLAFGTSEAYAWYYHAWAVLSMSGVALLLGSVASIASASRGVVLSYLPRACALAVALFGVAAMVRYSDSKDHAPPFAHGEASLAKRAEQAGIQRVFAFDRPGELAFYDGLSVLAADGLTTNAIFQRELTERGIGWALRRYGIQAAVIPRLGGVYGDLCGRLYLASLRFVCDEDDRMVISRLEAISRLNGESLGWIELAGRPRLEFSPHEELVVVLLGDRG